MMEYINHTIPSSMASRFCFSFSYTGFLFSSFLLVLLLFKWQPKSKQISRRPQTSSGSFAIFTFPIPTNWPVVGMLPGLLLHLRQIVLWLTSLTLQSGGSFMIRGPWFSKMEIFLTADPTNIQHIMSKRYDDFHKGSKFNEIFDAFGDGIFNVDQQLWKYQRKIAHATFTSPQFRKFLANTIKNKLENGLIPILERAYKEGLVVDLQDLFTRFTSDVTFITIMGYDPGSLSMDLTDNPVSSYIHNVEQNILMRHLLPEGVWKLQRWLGVGSEKRAQKSIEGAERIAFDCIAQKIEEVKKMVLISKKENGEKYNNDVIGDGKITTSTTTDDDQGIDLLTHYIMENHGSLEHGFKSTTKFLRDTLSTLVSAGQDTTSVGLAWFFWLLSQNPKAETKIKQELKENFNTVWNKNNNINASRGDHEEAAKSNDVYLNGAVCEALRLYPPVPFNHKASHEPLLLPSGHKVNPWTMIILNAFAMGRMKSIWGDDCLEFKPERWITDQGMPKHEPSHKFFTFNAGPRICLGKEMALVQMKAAISSIFLNNFRFQLVDGQCIQPGFSIILVMRNGLKVKVFKDNLVS